MDTTIVPTSTSAWELLAQLAQCAQQVAAPFDAASSAVRLGELLARYLPAPTGRLEVIEDDRVVATASWGDLAPEDPAPLVLRADDAQIGRLY
ncbi:MAG: hypothetical protein HGA45_28080, partial [Chloroflexales bacterium]|nr:hypothetical protein [Chloroflexales bacterium]